MIHGESVLDTFLDNIVQLTDVRIFCNLLFFLYEGHSIDQVNFVI